MVACAWMLQEAGPARGGGVVRHPTAIAPNQRGVLPSVPCIDESWIAAVGGRMRYRRDMSADVCRQRSTRLQRATQAPRNREASLLDKGDPHPRCATGSTDGIPLPTANSHQPCRQARTQRRSTLGLCGNNPILPPTLSKHACTPDSHMSPTHAHHVAGRDFRNAPTCASKCVHVCTLHRVEPARVRCHRGASSAKVGRVGHHLVRLKCFHQARFLFLFPMRSAGIYEHVQFARWCD